MGSRERNREFLCPPLPATHTCPEPTRDFQVFACRARPQSLLYWAFPFVLLYYIAPVVRRKQETATEATGQRNRGRNK